MFKRKKFLLTLGLLLGLSLASFVAVNQFIQYSPELKSVLIKKAQEQIHSIADAKGIQLSFSRGRPALRLEQVSLKKGQFASGQVEQLKLSFSLWRSLWALAPKIHSIKLTRGVIKVESFATNNQSGSGLALLDLERFRLVLQEVKLRLPKHQVDVKRLKINSWQDKQVEAELKLDQTELSVRATFVGTLQDWKTWSGFSYLKLGSFSSDKIKVWLPKELQSFLLGGEFWLAFDRAELKSFQSKFLAERVKTTYGHFSIVQAEASVQKVTRGYQVILQNVDIKKSKQAKVQLPYVKLLLSKQYQLLRAQLEKVEIKQIKDHLLQIKKIEQLQAIQQGMLPYVIFEREQDNWNVYARFANVAAYYQNVRYESISGLAEYIQGKLKLQLESPQLKLTQKGRPDFKIDQFRANIMMTSDSEGARWVVRGSQFRVGSALFNIDLSFSQDADLLKVIWKTEVTDPKRAIESWRYFDYAPGLKKWLGSALDSKGRAHIEGVYRGPTSNIRFGDNAQLEIDGELAQVNLNYSQGWPVAKQLISTLQLRNKQLLAQVQTAQLDQAQVKNISVELPNVFAEDPVVNVHGKINTNLEHVGAYINHSPLRETLTGLSQMKLMGESNLGINLHIPLSSKQKVQVKGEIDFEQAELDIPKWFLKFKRVRARLYFDEEGFSAKRLTGTLLDQPISGQILKEKNRTVIQMKGSGHYQKLLSSLQLGALAPLVEGVFNYQAELSLNKNKDDELDIQFKPVQLKTKITLPIISDLVPDRIRAYFKQGELHSFELQQKKELFRGEVKQGQYHFYGSIHYLDIDELLDLFKRLNHQDASIKDFMINLSVNELRYKGETFKGVSFKIEHHDKGTDYFLKTREFEGVIHDLPDRYHVELKHLNLNLNQDASKPMTLSLPNKVIDFNVRSLTINGSYLGRVRLMAEPVENKFIVSNASISQDKFNLYFSGEWDHQHTAVKGRLNAKSITPFLDIFKSDQIMRSNKTTGKFNLNWPGAPWQMKEKNLKGYVKVQMYNGFIPKLDESVEKKLGIAKLINLLSFTSIKRKLSLDFSDISRHGLDFSTVDSHLIFDSGYLRIKKLELDGNVLYVKAMGALNLNRKTFDLKLHINPYVTSSLPTIATIAGGPLAGIATWVANKAVNNLIHRKPFYLYSVTGPWDDPSVEQLKVK